MRHAVVFEPDHVIVAHLFDGDFGDHGLRLFGRILAAGLRVELLDDLHLFDDLLERHAERLGKLGQLVSLEAFEVIAHHLRREPVAVAEVVQLYQQ